MKVSFDIPITHLELTKYNDIDFILPINCENKEYKDFFKNSKKYKILDNGLAEDNQMNFRKLVTLAEELDVNEIVVPDDFESGRKSLKKTTTFIMEYGDRLHNQNIKLMGVVHGKNLIDYLGLLKKLYNNVFIDVIGIPFLLPGIYIDDSLNFSNENFELVYNNTQIYTLGRLMLTKYMYDNNMTDKPVHLLGMNNPIETLYQARYGFVRSIDSASPIAAGIQNIKYGSTGLKEKIRYDKSYYTTTIDKDQMEIVMHNINMVKKWAYVENTNFNT